MALCGLVGSRGAGLDMTFSELKQEGSGGMVLVSVAEVHHNKDKGWRGLPMGLGILRKY